MTFRSWLLGNERIDPEGYRVRVGALWTRTFLLPGWAIVVAGQVWMRSEKEWERYLGSRWWRAHEQHHIFQEREYFGGSSFKYICAFVWQYLRTLSHAKAPLEIEANLAADAIINGRGPGEPI